MLGAKSGTHAHTLERGQATPSDVAPGSTRTALELLGVEQALELLVRAPTTESMNEELLGVEDALELLVRAHPTAESTTQDGSRN